jgi:hypothetical protein
VLVLEAAAVTVAMYCLIQFYVQLRLDLGPHQPFLKVCAIKLVIFLSFWQSFCISILTSPTLNVVNATPQIAYPDLKIGISSALLCIEMAIFSVFHLFAFPYSPYKKRPGAEPAKYPFSPTSDHPRVNELGPNQGGFLGVKAFVDAMNPWDMVKGFARGMRWLFVGRKHREKDTSYQASSFDIGNHGTENDMAGGDTAYKPAAHLPIAEEFRRSKFGMLASHSRDDSVALLAYAQPNPVSPTHSGYIPAKQRYDANGQELAGAYNSNYDGSPDRMMNVHPALRGQESGVIGMAVGSPSMFQSQSPPAQQYLEQKRTERRQKPSEAWANSSRPARSPEEPPRPGPQDQLWAANRNQF